MSVKRFSLLFPLALVAVVSEPARMGMPFELQILSDKTGLGVANIRVRADNGLVCRTQRGTGACIWWAPSLMDRTVRFEIDDEQGRYDGFAAILDVVEGGQVRLKIHQRS
jgi:hypothetical protein